MYYFIGNNLGSTLTGIEKAQLNRMNLFNLNNQPASVVFVKYNPKLHENMKRFNIQENVFSIYDYFQDSIKFKEEHYNWPQYWLKEIGLTIEYVDNTYDMRIYDNEKFIMYAHFKDKYYSKIDYINYFDINRKKIKRDIFDSRGFLSKTVYLDNNNEVSHERYYDTSGNSVIEKFYQTTDGISHLTRILVTLSGGKVIHLRNEEGLLTLFTESIYTSGDVFFSDKNNVTFNGLSASRKDIPVVAVLHSTHIKYGKSQHINNVKNIYKPVFDNIERLTAIVTSTKSQKKDVSDLINQSIPVYEIPVGYIHNNAQIKNSKNKANKIISIGRYSSEKQQTLQLDLVERLLSDFPEIQLHMFGAGKDKDMLLKEVQRRNLNENVFIRGFKANLEEEIDEAVLNIMTSKMEGFSLSLLETLSQGVPTVCFDVQYGPSELINDNKNGYLVPLNNMDAFYDKVKNILSENTLRLRLSQGAVFSCMRYSSSKVFKKWEELIN
ncbi:glycosyltransferase [Jeotgalicoccus marinus]|uniref:glycosyltransferase n=1 Tax=Jeotgalicoccus marinus TaxID=516700 RepID=UPI0003F85E2A|nr:glycosyltransferase [Jeotgalicoccus marinus]